MSHRWRDENRDYRDEDRYAYGGVYRPGAYWRGGERAGREHKWIDEDRGYRDEDRYASGGVYRPGAYWQGGERAGPEHGSSRPAYASGYGSDDYGYGHHGGHRPEHGRGEHEPNRRHGYGGRGDDRERHGYGYDREGGRAERRDWWDRTSAEAASWFGDEDAERRRRTDERHALHRGRGPRGYTRSDDRIREDVSDRLTDDPYVDASGIEVSVSEGEVLLNGTVNSRADKRRAEDIAESVSGVKHVQNNLRVPPLSSGGDSGAVGSTRTSSYG